MMFECEISLFSQHQVSHLQSDRTFCVLIQPQGGTRPS